MEEILIQVLKQTKGETSEGLKTLGAPLHPGNGRVHIGVFVFSR